MDIDTGNILAIIYKWFGNMFVVGYGCRVFPGVLLPLLVDDCDGNVTVLNHLHGPGHGDVAVLLPGFAIGW